MFKKKRGANRLSTVFSFRYLGVLEHTPVVQGGYCHNTVMLTVVEGASDTPQTPWVWLRALLSLGLTV